MDSHRWSDCGLRTAGWTPWYKTIEPSEFVLMPGWNDNIYTTDNLFPINCVSYIYNIIKIAFIFQYLKKLQRIL